MDLNQPCYDSIIQIDKKLEELQKEVEFMEKEYGFKENHTNLLAVTNKTKTIASKTQTKLKSISEKTRYQNLPKVKSEENPNDTKKIKINPKISQKWKDTFRSKPDNNFFLEKNKIPSYKIDNEELCIDSDVQNENEDDYLGNYMKDYGLKLNVNGVNL